MAPVVALALALVLAVPDVASAGVIAGPRELAERKLATRRGAVIGPGDVSRTPVADIGFAGIDDRLGTTPASSTGALGRTWFVSAVNVHLSVFAPGTGTQRPGWPIRLRAFRNVLPSGAVESSPRVVYDPYADRFVLAFVGQDRARKPTRSWIVVATAPGAENG